MRHTRCNALGSPRGRMSSDSTRILRLPRLGSRRASPSRWHFPDTGVAIRDKVVRRVPCIRIACNLIGHVKTLVVCACKCSVTRSFAAAICSPAFFLSPTPFHFWVETLVAPTSERNGVMKFRNSHGSAWIDVPVQSRCAPCTADRAWTPAL